MIRQINELRVPANWRLVSDTLLQCQKNCFPVLRTVLWHCSDNMPPHDECKRTTSSSDSYRMQRKSGKRFLDKKSLRNTWNFPDSPLVLIRTPLISANQNWWSPAVRENKLDDNKMTKKQMTELRSQMTKKRNQNSEPWMLPVSNSDLIRSCETWSATS